MASSFFRDMLDQIVERSRAIAAFSLRGEDHGGTIETLSRGLLSGRGESSGMVVARHILAIFDLLTEDEKTDYFRFLNEALVPDDDAVRQAAEAGIPAVKYYLCAIENQRTESVPLGRGGSIYSTWDLEKADTQTPRFDEPVSAETNWGRISYFLERVIPVATEHKVRMACHPCDPWLPPGFKGVDRVMGGFDGFRRLISICPSPYHGVNLCLGCMAESVTDPANEVPEIIRYLGRRRKIHLIHYRNIFGGRNKFQEVWPDEGVMNMYRIMQTLKEVGYPHMIVPDHSPGHEDPESGRQGWAFQWGYIKAMIQAVSEAG